jgi:hypothetical protein
MRGCCRVLACLLALTWRPFLGAGHGGELHPAGGAAPGHQRAGKHSKASPHWYNAGYATPSVLALFLIVSGFCTCHWYSALTPARPSVVRRWPPSGLTGPSAPLLSRSLASRASRPLSSSPGVHKAAAVVLSSPIPLSEGILQASWPL